MSISLATLGMFRDCCIKQVLGVGGAVPGAGIQREASASIFARVKKVDIESKNIKLSKIKAVLKNAGE
jgi:hypothetical protein